MYFFNIFEKMQHKTRELCYIVVLLYNCELMLIVSY